MKRTVGPGIPTLGVIYHPDYFRKLPWMWTKTQCGVNSQQDGETGGWRHPGKKYCVGLGDRNASPPASDTLPVPLPSDSGQGVWRTCNSSSSFLNPARFVRYHLVRLVEEGAILHHSQYSDISKCITSRPRLKPPEVVSNWSQGHLLVWRLI